MDATAAPAAPPSSPPNAGLHALLALQGMTIEDLEANRVGRVTKRQLDLLGERMRRGALTVYGMMGVMVLFAAGFTAYDYARKQNPASFIFTAIMLAVALLPYLVYRIFRLPLPDEIADAKVTIVRGQVRGVLVAYNRGFYNLSLEGTMYTGLSAWRTPDATGQSGDLYALKSKMVAAYVVAGRKLVLAVETLA